MILPHLPFTDYRRLYAINNSILKHLGADGSPAHLVHALQSSMEDRDVLRYGRLLHTLTLEPERFEADYALFGGKVRSGKAWEEYAEVHADRTIIPVGTDASRAAFDAIQSQARAIRAFRPAAAILDGADTELTVVWTDPASGIVCKARLDVWQPHTRTLADIKSTRSTVYRRFQGQAAQLGYFEQLAFYARACRDGMGIEPERCCFIAAETAAPHSPAVFDVDSETLRVADDLITDRLATLAACRESGEWPDRYTEAVEMAAPVWWFPNEKDVDLDSLELEDDTHE